MSWTTRRIAALALVALPLLGCGSSNPYQGMGDRELFMLGQQKFEERDWDDAIRALDRFLVSFGTSELAPEARMLLADAYFAKGDFLTARSEYQRFLDRFAGHGNAPVAALGVCRSLEALAPIPQRDQTYTNDALGICRNVVVDYAGSEQAREAARIANVLREKLAEKEYLNGEYYFSRKFYDSAIIYYQFVVELYPETEWAPMSLLRIYRSNQAIGYDDLAEEARQRLLATYPDSPAAAEVRSDDDGS